MGLNSLKTGAILLLLFTNTLLFGQTIEKSDMIFKDQIKFSLSTMLYDNLAINQFSGEQLLKSKPVFSGEITISYYRHLKNNLGLNFGAGLGLAPFYINYNFKAPKNSIFQTGPYKEAYEYLGDIRHYEYANAIWVFPVSIQKIVQKKENRYYSFEGGIKINSVIAHPYVISVGHNFQIDDTTEARLFNFILGSQKKILLSYFLKAGLMRITKKQNTLQLNGVLHFCFSDIGIGDYEFLNLGFENTGQVGQKINYIGFEFTYGLTTSKRVNNIKEE